MVTIMHLNLYAPRSLVELFTQLYNNDKHNYV